MSVSFDNYNVNGQNGGGGVTSGTTNITISTSAKAAFAYFQNVNASLPSSVTLGGVAMTLVASHNSGGSSTTQNWAFYYLQNPPTGTNVACTFSGIGSSANWQLSVGSFLGASSTIGAGNTVAGTGTSVNSGAVVLTAPTMVVSFITTNASVSPQVPSGFTGTFVNFIGGLTVEMFYSTSNTLNGSKTFTATAGSSTTFQGVFYGIDQGVLVTNTGNFLAFM